VENPLRNIHIAYFSGTGGTEVAAMQLAAAFEKKDIHAELSEIRVGALYPSGTEDALFLLFAVHAFDAPKPVFNWLKELPTGNGKTAVVISVSGGGEISPNTACRVGVNQVIENKGWNVFYEKMLVMPCNIAVETKEPLSVKLLEILPEKINRIVDDVLSGKRRRTKPLWVDRMMAWVGALEKRMAPLWGNRIRVHANCVGCGWCQEHCPTANIRIENGKAAFSWNCCLCMKCLYGCPHKALRPGFAKFIVLKDGFDLKRLEQMVPYSESIDIEAQTKGFLWAGIRDYLLDRDA